MHSRFCMVAICAAAVLVGGCGGQQKAETVSAPPAPPSVLQGTVAGLCELQGGGDMVVWGHGLVVGLAGNGSSEAPQAVRDRIANDMRKLRIGEAATDTQMLKPDRLINDLDTAVVVVQAVIPAGTPAGATLDVSVQALPRTQTRSLDGGTLFMTELREYSAVSGRMQEGKVWARANGPIFINPFVETLDPSESARARQGRVIGGGETTKPRPIRLVLRQPDYRMAQSIMRQINDRFGGPSKVANALNPSIVEIRIPREFAGRHERFLDLLMHMYVPRGGGVEEHKARQLAQDILLPDSLAGDISLIWEAMGKQMLPCFRHLYASENERAAYFAARAGARLEDNAAVETMLRFAERLGSPYRLDAIAELGHVADVRAAAVLVRLLDDGNDLVRVAAYEALRDGRYRAGIEQVRVDDSFTLDLVPSHGNYLVYARRSGEPRLAIFGKGLRIAPPLFFNGLDNLVTLHAEPDDSGVRVYRRVGARRVLSDEVSSSFEIADILATLGRSPAKDDNGQFRGLGLTYSQVVSVAYRLCQDEFGKPLPADFLLQRPDETDRILTGMSPMGRPDTAGDVN